MSTKECIARTPYKQSDPQSIMTMLPRVNGLTNNINTFYNSVEPKVNAKGENTMSTNTMNNTTSNTGNNLSISGGYIPRDWLVKEPPAIEFCVNPLIPEGVVTIINGHGGTGKSLLALNMAVHIAFGLPIIGAETNSSKVAYISLEDPENIIRGRIFNIVNELPLNMMHRAGELATKLMIIGRYGAHMAAYGDGSIETAFISYKLFALLKEHDIKCVFVDTRINTLNENDMVFFEQIAKETGCAVVLVHRQPNGYGNEDYAVQGASAITDNARSVLYLEKVTEKDADKFYEDIKTDIIENRLVRVTHTKHNYSTAHPEQYFTISKDCIPIVNFPTILEVNNFDEMGEIFAKLLEWNKKVRKSRPVTKAIIEEYYNTEIQPEGSNYSIADYKNALIFAMSLGCAVEVDPPKVAGKNPKEKYYKLSKLG